MSSQNNSDSRGGEVSGLSADELHELVTSLQEGIACGRVKIPPGSLTEIGLKKVRLDANGKVDPKSVDSSVRAASYAAAAARAQREMRQIPLRDVQAEYFEILDQFFGKPFSEMNAHGVTAAQVAQQLGSSKKLVEAFQSDLEAFRSGIKDFWDYYGPVVETHLGDLRCLKSVYGGDVFPSYAKNVACSVGLYVDTLILPDPLFRLLEFAPFMEPQYACFMVAKHALSALRFRDLALADVNPPIVVIAPDPMLLDEGYTRLLQLSFDDDMLQHRRRIFDRHFATIGEVRSFLAELSTPDELTSKIVDHSRFLLDAEWSESPAAQLDRHEKEMASNMPVARGNSTGESAYIAFSGRFMQTNDLLLRSARYRANPVIEAPTSWQYLLWKYEYDASHFGGSDTQIRDLVISKAVETEGSEEFGMLSVPPDVLIELRRLGAMQAAAADFVRRHQ